MKIAFLADIHGNYFALNRVLNQLKKEKIKQIYFLGDYVNYFYEPKKFRLRIFVTQKNF